MPQPLFPVATLPPGTTSYNLVGLSAGQQYTAVVAHKEDPPSAGYTAPSQVSWTESATVGACAAPDDPVAFALLPPLTAVPVYGFACYNNEPVPGTGIAIQMATETSVGSGSFGAWVTIAVISAAPESWVTQQIALPSDGCHRAFQAQAQRAGTTASAFTPTVTLMPGVSQPPADYPIAIPAALLSASGYEPVDVIAPTGMTVAILSAYTPPTDHDFDHMEYIVSAWTGTSWGSPQVVVGSNQGSDTIVAQATAGGAYQITPVTVSAGATGVQVVPGVPLAVTRNNGSAISVTVPALSNAPVPTLQGVNATTATFTLPFDVGTAYFAVYAVLYSSNPGTVETVEAPNNTIANATFGLAPQIYPPPGGESVSLQLGGLTSTDQWMVATFVPYSQAGIRGVATTIPATRSTTTIPAAPTLSLATFGGTGGTNGGTGPNGGSWNHPYWVGVKVTFVSTPSAGDTVTLYRSGAQVGSTIVTTAEVGAGFCTIVDTTFASGTAPYTAVQTGTVSGGGNSAPSSALSVTVGAGYTLSGLASLALTGGAAYGNPMFVDATAASDGEMPPDGAITIQYGISSSSSVAPTVWNTISADAVSGYNYTISTSGQPARYWMWVQAWVAGAGYTTSTVTQTKKQLAALV